ncbi:MAG: S8 family peptidase [Acidobacteria bacterium]|nr:MAG: S8 family peptidase [Acidobacteriota bacterium]
MKRLGVFLVIAILAAPVLAQSGAGPISIPFPGEDGKYIRAKGKRIEGSYIVVFDSKTPAGSVAAGLARSYGAKYLRSWSPNVLNGALMVNLPEKAARALARRPFVRYVEEDAVITLNAVQSNPPSWGLDRVDQCDLPLDNLYDDGGFNGTGVHAYVIDTGIRPTHNDFGGRASADFDSVGDGQNGIDCNGHGTHVSGTLGGSAHGVAKNVTLHGVRVLNCQGSGSTSGVISGVDFVTNNHISPAVANMSLGGGISTSLDNAVNNSVAAGVFYAVAAGNDNANACNSSPARAAEAFTVGSTTSTDARSSFSNFGTCVDIFAPGSSITSAWHTSDSATNTISGTSMASPHVAGAAALILDENPGWTPDQVKAELTARASADRISNPGTGSPNLLLQVLSTNDCNAGAPPPPPPPSGCPAGFTVFTSTISSGSQTTSDFAGSGTFDGRLLCSDPVTADLDLFLDVQSCNFFGCSFSAVASSTSANCDESILTTQGSATYRWRVDHFSGGTQSFTLCVNQP